jgi:hypothetical protein
MSEYLKIIEGSITEPVDQHKIINEALSIAGHALGYSYMVYGLKTHIQGEMVIGGKTFKLTFYEQGPEAGANESEIQKEA